MNKDRVSGSQIYQEGRDQRHGLLGGRPQTQKEKATQKPQKDQDRWGTLQSSIPVIISPGFLSPNGF